MRLFAIAAFGLLIIASPAWAQTPDDNPVINAYRNYGTPGGTPTDNFMYDAYQRHGPGGTPTDNFMRDMYSPPSNTDAYHQDFLPSPSPRRDSLYGGDDD